MKKIALIIALCTAYLAAPAYADNPVYLSDVDTMEQEIKDCKGDNCAVLIEHYGQFRSILEAALYSCDGLNFAAQNPVSATGCERDSPLAKRLYSRYCVKAAD